MKARYFIPLFPILFSCGGQSLDAGTNSEETDAESQLSIIGGHREQRWPAVGALLHNGHYWCTGTLIAPRTVLTAGHCVTGAQPWQIEFAVGPRAGRPTSRVRARELRAHPNFSPWLLSHDIGIVLLSEPVEGVTPISPLQASMDDSWVGRPLLFVGYGAIDGAGEYGNGRKRSAWIDVSAVNPFTFRYDGAQHMTCWGDSGGPALAFQAGEHPTVVGVTSWGDSRCAHFAVDARVDAHLGFIEDALGSEASRPQG